jgi:hypothetical protein
MKSPLLDPFAKITAFATLALVNVRLKIKLTCQQRVVKKANWTPTAKHTQFREHVRSAQ